MHHLHKWLHTIGSRLDSIFEEILSLAGEDASLRDKAFAIEVSLQTVKLRIERLLHEQESSPERVEKVCVSEKRTVELYKISAPTFSGDILN